MPLLVSLGEIRDVVIIVWGVIGAIFFFVALVVVAVIGLSVKGLLNNVKGMLNDNVKPTLSSVREAAETVRGTTEFVSKTTVSPVVKAYGTMAGVKKGFSVLTKVKGRSK